MISGTYAISMQTPMGLEKGTITLNETDGTLSGFIRTGGTSDSFTGGTVEGNRFSFSGIIRKMFLKIPYTARGEINGDTFHASADTKYGEFFIDGTRKK